MADFELPEVGELWVYWRERVVRRGVCRGCGAEVLVGNVWCDECFGRLASWIEGKEVGYGDDADS